MKKQDQFKTDFKIAARTGLLTQVFVFMLVKKDVIVIMSFKAQTTKNLCHSKLKTPKINRRKKIVKM